ncbi:elongation factor P maturation arginine rhamnosyltransferase EarP [Chitinolyticbacter albus]|uniref:elongation factor P maturation arginine rhamnosyltransferase EarP n=1 Tax=Chitinolyticbacter albus TaxID=2961951 RepID=UPI00210E1889|nr:elongation factor P maturation arginine rhamnosyltransferase EarP [Chitinolyticbacter albus]
MNGQIYLTNDSEHDAVWTWDLFCRVVDNYGDAGVCWRLARDLAARGQRVRLWIDELHALARIWPQIDATRIRQQVAGVEVAHWEAASSAEPGDVVIEAFACDLPAGWPARMRQRQPVPVWLNLEYLSAEDWVQGCHGLASPREGMAKYFFFPGFERGTGGLLAEPGLAGRRAAWAAAEAAQWRSAQGAPLADVYISLFAYEVPATLVDAWLHGPLEVCCLVPAGRALRQLCDLLQLPLPQTGSCVKRGPLTVLTLPFLRQDEYDHLLWSCDLNLVRGEDSFVRAQWAALPMAWQIYRQEEDAHLVKLDAFLGRYCAGLPEDLTAPLRRFWLAFNGAGQLDWPGFAGTLAAQGPHARRWAAHLHEQGDLVTNLVSFARSKLQ